MAHREPPCPQILLEFVGQPQKAQRIGDRGAVTADPLSQLFLRPPELSQQAAIRLRLFDRVQVLAQEILDERKLEALGVRRLPNDRGNALEPRLSCCAPAAFPRNELI